MNAMEIHEHMRLRPNKIFSREELFTISASSVGAFQAKMSRLAHSGLIYVHRESKPYCYQYRRG